MSENFNVEDIFNILKEKFYKETAPAIESFKQNGIWGDIKIEMEIIFQEGKINRVTPGSRSQEHHKGPKK